jgi:hypothetical protein
MQRRTATILVASLALGVLADLLMRGEPWGANVPAGVLPFLAVLASLGGGSSRGLVPGWKLPAAMCVGAALLPAWRASPVLQGADVVFILMAILFTVTVPASRSLGAVTIADLAGNGVVHGVHALLGPVFLLSKDLVAPPAAARTSPAWALTGRVARGAAIAVPPLFLFGVLFMAADPVFDRGAHALLDVDFPAVLSHILLTLGAAWVFAGFFRGRFLADPVPPLLRGKPVALSLGIVEMCVVLGAVLMLFGAFLAVQLRYLFGGAPLVVVVPGLTYAAYARQGFFQLVAACAFVLPLVLCLEYLFTPSKAAHRVLFRLLTLLLLGFVAVLMLSALQRMSLYREEYGLTESRFYATAFMAWMGMLLLCFGLTVLRGRRELFVPGAFAASLVLLAVLHALNPDGLIVDTNVRRSLEGKPFDAPYNACLSDDALPALRRALDVLPEAGRLSLLQHLRARHAGGGDLRSWNLSRRQAALILSSLPVAQPSSTSGKAPAP